MSLNMEAIKKSVDELKSKGFKKREIEICQHCGWVGLRVMADMKISSIKKKFMFHEVSCGRCFKKIRTFSVLSEERENDDQQRARSDDKRKRYLA